MAESGLTQTKTRGALRLISLRFMRGTEGEESNHRHSCAIFRLNRALILMSSVLVMCEGSFCWLCNILEAGKK